MSAQESPRAQPPPNLIRLVVHVTNARCIPDGYLAGFSVRFISAFRLYTLHLCFHEKKGCCFRSIPRGDLVRSPEITEGAQQTGKKKMSIFESPCHPSLFPSVPYTAILQTSRAPPTFNHEAVLLQQARRRPAPRLRHGGRDRKVCAFIFVLYASLAPLFHNHKNNPRVSGSRSAQKR